MTVIPGRKLTGIHDAPHGHESRVAVSHISEAPVLPRPHVHHPASVVRLLVHQPVAVHHIAGLAVRHAVTVHDGVTVIHHLHHLTSKLLLIVDPHPELSSVLLTNNLLQNVFIMKFRGHYNVVINCLI